MKHLKYELLNKSIVGWVEENFVKAILPFNPLRKEFKFVRIEGIPKVWKESDCWLVEARIAYSLRQAESTTITFQMNDDGEIIGYRFHEQSP